MPERVRLEAEAQQAAVAVERVVGCRGRRGTRDQPTVSVTLRNRSDCTSPPGQLPNSSGLVAMHGLNPHGLAEQRSREDLSWGHGIRVDHNPESLIER